MSILHNLPYRFIELTQREMIIGFSPEGEPYLDIQTGMKSHMFITYRDGKYIAEMRYGRSAVLETFGDFVVALRQCECHKGFMSIYWDNIFTNGFGEFEDEKFG